MTRRSITTERILSIGLGSLGAVFALLSGLSFYRQAIIFRSWPLVDAVVSRIDTHSIGDNKYGVVDLTMTYRQGGSYHTVQASRSFLPGRGEAFVQDYSVGTKHQIYLNPAAAGWAEVKTNWNLDTLLMPLIFALLSLGLFASAVYFGRKRGMSERG